MCFDAISIEYIPKEMKKIFICAYACSPYRGSEPGVGWGFAYTLAQKHHVTLVTEQIEFKDDIERYRSKYPDLCRNLNIIFIPRRNYPFEYYFKPLYYLSYRAWHKAVFEYVKQYVDIASYDIVHQLNMVGFREPGYLWKFDAKFAWGPIGGLGYFPWKFLPKLPLIYGLGYFAYNVSNYIQMKFSYRVHRAAKKAASNQLLISATAENAKFVTKYFCCNSHILSEVGVPSVSTQQFNHRSPSETLRIVWVGLMIPRKNFDTLINVMDNLRELDIRIDAYGSGPNLKKYQDKIKKRNLTQKITLHGWVERCDIISAMQKSHLMVITSLRDLTSTVLIEAMSANLPILAPNHCGFPDILNKRNGLLLDVTSPKSLAVSLERNIKKLFADEELRTSLGKQAGHDAKSFVWEEKLNSLLKIYNIE